METTMASPKPFPTPIRFRTQDTKLTWARKINQQFSTVPKLRETPQTLEQWQHELNKVARTLKAQGYVTAYPIVFRLSETRAMWCRKLNLLIKSQVAGTKPVSTVAPAITGTAQVGQTLTVTNGTWTGAATITYARQWQAGGVNIAGATGTTYVPVVGDIGKVITCRVTATNGLGSTAATSNATAAVIAA
jgi:hypothetical protein